MDRNCGDNGGITENTTEEMEYNKIWAAFNEMRINTKLCDAVLVANDGKTFPVHKAILAANSPHYHHTFTAVNSNEANSVPPTFHSPEYITEDVEGEHLEAVVEYMYNRVSRITMDNALSILEYAEKVQIKGLADQCAIFLSTGLNCSNCIEIWTFSKANNKEQLKNKSQSYILGNFISVSKKNVDFLHLTGSEIEDFIQDNNLSAKTEEAVFESIIKWVDFDPSARARYIPTFLDNLRLGLIKIEYFIENISCHPYVVENKSCIPLVKMAWKFLYDLQRYGTEHVDLENKLFKPRVPRDVLFTIGGWSGDMPVSAFETYDTRADRWYLQQKFEENTPRSYHGMALVDNMIYIIGGYDGVVYYNALKRFNPVTCGWQDLSPMYSQRCYVATVACNGYIYAMGGYDGRGRLNSVERYDPSRNQWSRCKHMRSKRSDAGADTIGGKVYVAGGFDGEECLSTLEVYSPETDQWTICAKMSQARSGISVVAHSGVLYAVGGFDGTERLATGEKYDPLEKTWKPIKSMYAARSNSGIAVIDDMIFVMGGFNGQSTVEHVECYDSEQDEWLDATDMTVARSAFKACVVRSLPNVQKYTYYGSGTASQDPILGDKMNQPSI